VLRPIGGGHQWPVKSLDLCPAFALFIAPLPFLVFDLREDVGGGGLFDCNVVVHHWNNIQGFLKKVKGKVIHSLALEQNPCLGCSAS